MPKRSDTALTKRYVEGLQAEIAKGKRGDTTVFDGKCPGFGLRVKPSGHAFFFVQYRRDGKSHRCAIGAFSATPGAPWSVEDARLEAQGILNRIKRDADFDPLRERQERQRRDQEGAGDTFQEIAASYIKRVAIKQNRSWRETARIFGLCADCIEGAHRDGETCDYKAPTYTKPLWSRRIGSISRADVNGMLDDIEDNSGPVMADRTLAAVRRLFNWYATRDGHFISPVVKGMARTKPKELARDRVLSDDEIKAVWEACETAQPPVFGSMVRMLLATAQRRGEVAEMRWSEIEGETWTIPAERYKTKRANVVPLSKLAQTVLVSVPRHEGCDLVFTTGPRERKNPETGAVEIARDATPFGNLGEAKAALDDASGVADWTLHDLRRTARTLMERAGVRPDIAERVLGHVLTGVVFVYNKHDYAPEKRHALEALASAIEDAIKPKEKADKKIITYRPRRAASGAQTAKG